MSDIHNKARLNRIDLNLFRVFDVVYRQRNLSRAGEELFISQSAVSHALSRLREQLDDPLFIREGKGVTPTPLADRLAPEIRAALGLFQQAVNQREFDPRRDIQHLTIAIHNDLESVLLPQIVNHLRARAAPGVTIAGVRLQRRNLATDLASRRIDLAIGVAHPTSADLRHALLFRDAFCVVSRQPIALDRERYMSAQHIAVSSRRAGLTVEDVVLNQLGFQRDVALRCQHYDAACRIVANSDLLLTMPSCLAHVVNSTIGNVLLDIPIALPPVELHVYWHQQWENDPGTRWLRDQLLALLGPNDSPSHLV
ncbi:LysR family transcriptional regulator [Alkalilimnicola ehrlichii]|uniref:LysR family transcriptional regulator n=1 Tax=Alkalilimnicola ehrlichii TaxID=351052 RepID=A0A3E0WIK4_9GAMM|nr:LysR family transcriptional regulator [Alkalilimnicola ehrlichii]RFA24697.1 LysR family transcriptional regulator [Alkalilimnicola ehrlichii]RFA31796.1 LysR family transcriptional regulator [Alkalilimnicola ehrlichii]